MNLLERLQTLAANRDTLRAECSRLEVILHSELETSTDVIALADSSLAQKYAVLSMLLALAEGREEFDHEDTTKAPQ